MSGDFFARYGLTVNAANVLGVRRVILEEADALRQAVKDFRYRHPDGMPRLGGDPVSKDAAEGFTEVTERLLAQGEAHINGLFELGDELAAAARAYGHTERAITDSFAFGQRAPESGLTPVQQPPPALRGVWVALTVLGLALAGCAATQPAAPPSPRPTSVAPSRSLLPPRPAELRMDEVAPCSLLTAAQIRKLGTNPDRFVRETAGGPLGGDSCSWTNFPERPDLDWRGGPTFKNGAEFLFGREPLRTIDGYTATTTSLATDPSYNCVLLLDVAPGQALQVTFDNARKDYPGMNHTLSCDKAQQVASYLLGNLRAQLGR